MELKTMMMETRCLVVFAVWEFGFFGEEEKLMMEAEQTCVENERKLSPNTNLIALNDVSLHRCLWLHS